MQHIIHHNIVSPTIAIYIHWPFCRSKCPYCDFNSHVRDTVDYQAWLDSYLLEIEFFRPTIRHKMITSIFFGGGTPSLMPPFIVKAIIDKIATIGVIDAQTEITLEANPTSSEAENFMGYKAAGVNRLSIGIQALRATDLKFLGREHDIDEAVEVIKLAASLFQRFSFDLIYARPQQTLVDWLVELKQATDLAVSHISLYQLTVEKGTEFYRSYRDKKFTLPDNDLAADLYFNTNEYLAQCGFEQYETSNYAKAGEESRHNLAYWQYDDYIGIGPGAHSRLSFRDDQQMWQMQAFANIALPENWLKKVNMNNNAIQTYEQLSAPLILHEILLMGLRLRKGITESKINKFFNKNFLELIDNKILQKLQDNRFIEYSAQHLRTTKHGASILNTILLELIDY